MTNILRPDEEANQAQIERSKRHDQSLKNGAKTALAIGSSAVGAGLTSRLLPFLNEYITPDLALKGISKISPKIGDFLKKGMSEGLNVQDGLNFLKDKLEPKQGAPQEAAKENRSVIEQYSDELHAFLDDLIKKGRQPLEAGALAQLNPKFKSIIAKMEKDHKTPFSSILQAIYGSAQQAAPQQGQSKGPLAQRLAEDNQTKLQPQQSQQGGQGQQALMAILQKIQQQRGQ